MTRAASIRLAKDALTVAVTFFLLLLLVFPFLWVVLTSIRPASELFSDEFQLMPSSITLANYRAVFASGFAVYVRNSLLVSIPATIISAALSFLAAYGFSRRTFRLRYTLLIFVVFLQLFPFIVLTTPIYFIYYRVGLVNNLFGLILTYIAITIPFSIYMLLGYLDSVPRELDEAAIIDGCSTIGVMLRVVLPIAWPGVAATAIYTFVQAWNEFLFALTLITDNDLKTIPIGLANLFGQYTTQWDLVMSASVVATLPTLIIFLFLQRQLVSGLAAGAVKQ
ncbi:MAG: carbohydrate ABC transporter permease [Caldilineaceae bacterium]|nr:carbohydrate ABC transporter permease [Caldilineaceae bacterium]